MVNLSSSQQEVMNDAIAVLRAQGAFVQEHADIPTQPSLNAFGGCGTHGQQNCSTVLLYGFKRDLNAYLASLGPGAPVHTLADVIAYNHAHAPESIKYGQVLAIESDLFDLSPGSADTLRYQNDRAMDLALSRGGLDAIYNGPDGIPGTADDFDAILFAANRGANIAARAIRVLWYREVLSRMRRHDHCVMGSMPSRRHMASHSPDALSVSLG